MVPESSSQDSDRARKTRQIFVSWSRRRLKLIRQPIQVSDNCFNNLLNENFTVAFPSSQSCVKTSASMTDMPFALSSATITAKNSTDHVNTAKKGVGFLSGSGWSCMVNSAMLAPTAFGHDVIDYAADHLLKIRLCCRANNVRIGLSYHAYCCHRKSIQGARAEWARTVFFVRSCSRSVVVYRRLCFL